MCLSACLSRGIMHPAKRLWTWPHVSRSPMNGISTDHRQQHVGARHLLAERTPPPGKAAHAHWRQDWRLCFPSCDLERPPSADTAWPSRECRRARGGWAPNVMGRRRSFTSLYVLFGTCAVGSRGPSVGLGRARSQQLGRPPAHARHTRSPSCRPSCSLAVARCLVSLVPPCLIPVISTHCPAPMQV